MLELGPLEIGVIACAARPPACDAVASAAGDRSLRLAPDEVMVLAEPGAAGSLATELARTAAEADPHAVVLDASDGWAGWSLRGDSIDAAMARLTPLEVPRDGFVQGDVARVPVKVVAAADRLDLLVPAMWGEYLRDAILQRCRGLGIREAGGS